MNRTALRIVAVLALLVFGSVWLFGQAETGSITGTVTDSSNAVVSGATVTAASVNTGTSRTVTTASAGEYTITNLKPDTYTLTIEHAGFQKYTTKFKVDVGSRGEVSAQLAVTGNSTTVEVTAAGETAAVNTESQTLSTVVTSSQITDLPTLTRNPYDLVATSGNVSEDSMSNRGAGYAINGQRSSDTDILLDGGENVDLFTASVGQSVPLDSVQEFSVLTSNYTAEFGRAGGGVINVSTKSGTNNFHGTLYEFNRVSALAANTYQNDSNDIAKPGFTRNQFGYSIGGPIIKNKLFFFSSTEWTRVRSDATNTQSIIDPAYLSVPGVSQSTINFFNAYGSKLEPGIQILSKTDYGTATGGNCGNPIPCNAPFGETIAYSVPSDSGAGSPQNTYSTVERVDYNFSDKTTLYGRYALYSEDDFAGFINSSPYEGYNTGQNQFNQSVIINLTHVFTPNLVNSAKFLFNRLNLLQPLGTNPVSPTLYTSATALPNLPGTIGALIFPGYAETTPGNAIPFGGPQNVYQVFDDLSWTKGRHQFKFGGGYIQTRDNREFGAYENSVESLTSGGSIAGAAANLTSGLLYQFQGAVYPQGQYPCSRSAAGTYVVTPSCLLDLPVTQPSFSRNNRYNDGSFYVQDSWKATARLTVNLGVRWEYYGVQHNSDPALDSNFYLGTGATLFDQVRNGTAQIANQSPVGGLWGKDLNNWAPRVGFAYDVFGNGTMSLRGGYGIGYERNFGNVTYNVIQNPPNYGVVSVISGTDVPAGTLPIYTNNLGPLAGSGSTCGGNPIVVPGTSCFPNPSLRAVQQNIPTAYTQFWSGALDYQVMKNSVLSVEYTGSKGTHEYSIANLNAGGYGSEFLGDARTANRLNYQYSNINYRGADGFNLYNGVNFKFQSNNLFNKGLYVTANYTWSHAIDNLSSTFSDGTSGLYGLGFLDPYNANLDKGNADYDIRNRFVLSGTWNIPYGSNMSQAWERQVLGGWSFSPILNVRSGLPYSIYDCTNLSLGYTCPRYIPGEPINQNGGVGNTNNSAAGPNLFNYLPLPLDSTGSPVGNGDALAVPNCLQLDHGECSYSISGLPQGHRNAYSGPGYWNFNFVAAKTFKLTERFNLQFRGEFYNAFNHSNYYITTGNLDIEQGTGVTAIQAEKGIPYVGATERRNIQFGLKLNF
ncbi:MAG TPA: TonB-dependent receptor [Candidatus Angelobacter sp.]|nr:TonB-dependent receptor [Candidatus Angelobacter sp.]